MSTKRIGNGLSLEIDSKTHRAAEISRELQDAAKTINNGHQADLSSYIPIGSSYIKYSPEKARTDVHTSPQQTTSQQSQATNESVNKVLSGLSETHYNNTIKGQREHAHPVLETVGRTMPDTLTAELRDTDAGQTVHKIAMVTGALSPSLTAGMMQEAASLAQKRSIKIMSGDTFSGFRAETARAKQDIEEILGKKVGKLNLNSERSISKFEKSLNNTAQKVGLGDLRTKSYSELQNMLQDKALSSQQHQVLQGMLDVQNVKNVKQYVPETVLHSINKSASLPKIDYTKKSSIQSALSRFGQELRKKGMTDYTSLDINQLKRTLKRGTLSNKEKTIVETILGLKQADKFAGKISQRKRGENFKRLRLLTETIRDTTTYAGYKMSMQLASAVKTSLKIAKKTLRLAGKNVLRVAAVGAKVFSGFKPGTYNKVMTAPARLKAKTADFVKGKVNKVTHKIGRKVEYKKLKLTKKFKKSKVGQRFGKLNSRLKNSKFAKFSKKAQDAAKKILNKLGAPFRGIKKLAGKFGAFNAWLNKIKIYGVAVLGALVLIIQAFYCVFSIASGGVSSSTAASVDSSGNQVTDVSDSYFVQIYNELMSKETDWFSGIENAINKTPSEVLTEAHKENDPPDRYETNQDTGQTVPVYDPQYVWGYYDPTEEHAHKIQSWGVPMTDEDGNEIKNGLTSFYYDGDSELEVRYSNVKMCMSIGHAFVGGNYSRADIFYNFCMGLWDASNVFTVTLSEIYSCGTGCDTYWYMCTGSDGHSMHGPYSLNTTNPEHSKYVCVINGNMNGTTSFSGSLVPRSSDGCIQRIHNHTNASYTDHSLYSNNTTGFDGSTWQKTLNCTYTINGRSIPATTTCTVADECNDYEIIRHGSNGVLDATSSCDNQFTVRCSGCETTYHQSENEILTECYNKYMTYEVFYCFDNAEHIENGSSCPCGHFTIVSHKHESNVEKTKTFTTNYGDVITFTYYDSSCPSGIPELAIYRYTDNAGRARTYRYVKYVCECEDKVQCLGTETVHYACLGHATCPGHSVCGGHAECQGHWRCDGHTANICLGHVDGQIDAMIVGLDENNNLRVKTEDINYNGQTYNDMAAAVGFGGWGADTEMFIYSLYNQDWGEAYGLSISSYEAAHLDSEEIAAIFEEYDIDESTLSKVHVNVLSWALNSVGKIPYHWGGKPAVMGYDGNDFGASLSTPAITPGGYACTQRGLDCSGWIEWIFWTGTGTREYVPQGAGYFYTQPGRYPGTYVPWEDAQPGDILCMNGHVGLFVGWVDKAAGEMLVCHETPPNVTVQVMNISQWDSLRRVLPDADRESAFDDTSSDYITVR